MSDVFAMPLLRTPNVVVHDICCAGTCRGHSDEEATRQTRLVFAYRGVFVRHVVGQDEAVAEANQVLFFNAGEGYRVSIRWRVATRVSIWSSANRFYTS